MSSRIVRSCDPGKAAVDPRIHIFKAGGPGRFLTQGLRKNAGPYSARVVPPSLLAQGGSGGLPPEAEHLQIPNLKA